VPPTKEAKMSEAAKHEDKNQGEDKKRVKVEVDNHPKHIPPGIYVVSDFKSLVDVPAEKELDQVINGNLTTLDDSASVTIKGGEVFFSHVRRGGSS
jgi:hypothetical protein